MQRVFERLRESGDIYLGKYEGWYCSNDETFWLESKLVDGRCPNPDAAAKCSGFRKTTGFSGSRNTATAETIIATPSVGAAASAYNEMMAMLEEGLEDFSISRSNLDWGIPIPGGGGVIYVWFDALLNYITAIGWSEDETRFKHWPASVQLVGKEIARFHTIIWPAFCGRSAKRRRELVFAHGWITLDGQKIGKSLGNAVDPFASCERFGADAMRYFLLREGHFGSDFSYSEDKNRQRYNSELGQRSRQSLPPHALDAREVPQRPRAATRGTALSASDSPNCRARRSVDPQPAVPRRARSGLGTGHGAQPRDRRAQAWALAKAGENAALDALLYDLCEGLRWLAILLAPFMPRKGARNVASTRAGGRHRRAWERRSSGAASPPVRRPPSATRSFRGLKSPWHRW